MSAFLSFGSLSTIFSKAGNGILMAVGIAPSMKRGAGRASISRYLPFSGPWATSFSTSAVVICFSGATLMAGLAETSVANFLPSFSVYSIRTSLPFLMSRRGSSVFSPFTFTTFSVALSNLRISVASSILIWIDWVLYATLSKFPLRLPSWGWWQLEQIFAMVGFAWGAPGDGAAALSWAPAW